MGLEYGISYAPSSTPAIRKSMLDNCLPEYDENLRGIVSGLPLPCAVDITSSVPIYRPIVKKHKSSASKAGDIHEKNLPNVLCGNLSVIPGKGDKRKEHTIAPA